MRFLILIFYLLLILFGVTFSALNAQTVYINFYVTGVRLPIALVIILALGIGMFLGWVVFFTKYWRRLHGEH